MAASEVAAEYDEVRFVELGPVRPFGGRAGLDVVAAAVANALELTSRSPDFKEGLAAFRESRPPHFEGR